MSDRGVYAIDRGVWEHPCFAPEPYTEREAWMWLISSVAWEAKRVRVGDAVIALERGQCAFSLRFMAAKWKWSEARVRRFLKRLKTDAMIDAVATHQATHITLCNYDKYAFGRRSNEQQTDASSDARATHERRKEEETKNLRKEDSEAKASAAVAAPVFEDSTHELWHEGVAILGQLGLPDRPARSNIGRWLKDAKQDAARVLGAIQRARDARTRDPVAFVTGALRTNLKPHRGSGFLDLALEIGEHEHSDYPQRVLGASR